MGEELASAIPGVGAVAALTWLLARTFLRVEDRRDSEYRRLTEEIGRKDAVIKRLEDRIDELEEENRRLRSSR